MKCIDRLKCVVPFFLLLFVGLADAAGLGVGVPGANGDVKDFSFLPARSVSVDFDGDHLPDTASGTYDGNAYRVEIGFSSGKSPASIAFSASWPAFNLFAHDIDHDNDQDLVIVNASSRFPSAVWLNDNEGHFEKGSRWSWLTFFTSDDAPGFDSGSSQNGPVSLSRDYYSFFQLSAPRAVTLESRETLPRPASCKFTSFLLAGSCTRAPPHSFLLPDLNSRN